MSDETKCNECNGYGEVSYNYIIVPCPKCQKEKSDALWKAMERGCSKEA